MNANELERDPMQSHDPALRRAYFAEVMKTAESVIEATRAERAARWKQPAGDEYAAVIQGALGFGNGTRALD